MKPRILVISNYSNYQSTRPEAEIFKGLAKKGYAITIMTKAGSDHIPEFREQGIEVIEFEIGKKFHKPSQKKIRDLILSKKIDVLHCYNSKASSNGIPAVKGLDTKLVLYRGYPGNVSWLDPSAYTKYLHPRVDAIICNSQAVEEHFHRQPFFDKSKTITILKGHRLEWFEGVQAKDIRAEFGIPEKAFLTGTVANNRSEKGIPFLIKSLNRLPAEMPIHHVLIGRNMDQPKVLKLIKGSPMEGKIHFLGYRKDGLSIVKGLDAHILSSVRAESITKTAIEALALGTPSIMTSLPGNNELIKEEVSCLSVPPHDTKAMADAILRIYEDEPLRHQLSMGGPKQIQEEVHADKTVEGMEKLYGRWFSV